MLHIPIGTRRFVFLLQEEEDEGDVPRNGRYTLKSVKKIDHYSRYKGPLLPVSGSKGIAWSKN